MYEVRAGKPFGGAPKQMLFRYRQGGRRMAMVSPISARSKKFRLCLRRLGVGTVSRVVTGSIWQVGLMADLWVREGTIRDERLQTKLVDLLERRIGRSRRRRPGSRSGRYQVVAV